MSYRIFFVLSILLTMIGVVHATTYTYDSLHRLTSVTHDNGDVTTYGYDAGGSFSTALTPLVATVPVPNFAGPIFSFTFSGAEPDGNYIWFAMLAQPGTLNITGWVQGTV